MDENKLNLVKTIFNSPAFRAQTPQQQRETINKIISTGEVQGNDVDLLYN